MYNGIVDVQRKELNQNEEDYRKENLEGVAILKGNLKKHYMGLYEKNPILWFLV